MAGQGYKVDLDALWTTVNNLKALASAMDDPKSKAKYFTNLTQNQVGKGFAEASTLYQAHEDMKNSINEMVGNLQTLLEDFGSKASSVHSAYANQEAGTKSDFGH
jgi:methyl-accepting chemotaxis protein